MATRSEPRLLLIRHGRSAHVGDGAWIDAAGVRRWRDAYDAAGVAPDDVPPPALLARVATAEFLIASDARRAIESAERLAEGRPVLHAPLLREAPLEIPAWVPLRWPLGVWDACMVAQWGYRRLRGTDASPAELSRAASAAKWLAGLACDGSPVVAVTHGVFRRLLAARLIASGWEPDGPLRNYRHWSAWAFRTGRGR